MNPQPAPAYSPIAVFSDDELPEQLFRAAVGVARGKYRSIKVMPLDFALDLDEGASTGYGHHVLFASGLDHSTIKEINPWFDFKGERSQGGRTLTTLYRLPVIGDERLKRMGYAPAAVVMDMMMCRELGQYLDDLVKPGTLVLPAESLLPIGYKANPATHTIYVKEESEDSLLIVPCRNEHGEARNHRLRVR